MAHLTIVSHINEKSVSHAADDVNRECGSQGTIAPDFGWASRLPTKSITNQFVALQM